MIWRGTQTDALLRYKWITANYWTIEDSLYGIFKECLLDENKREEYNKLKEDDADKYFNKRLKDNFHEVEDMFYLSK